MQDIKELSLKELEEVLKKWSKPLFHARQIFSWIYKKKVVDFNQMSDLPLDLRQRLETTFCILGFSLENRVKSRDKTEKFLFKLKDNNLIESALIPSESRMTGCISTQVGCKFNCAFCASGIGGFKRNLEVDEILDQVLFLSHACGKLSHIVFMGIGEPLDNYQNLIEAIKVINSPRGFNIGARRITVSTCGLIPQIKKLARENLQIELSISLHAPDNPTRNELMPINKKYPISELIKTCRDYVKQRNRQITFEYIMVKDLNSDLQKAKDLVKILQGLNCKVNLIAYNPISEFNWQAPGKLAVLLFKDYLKKNQINVTLRKPRGIDIKAGCGQLRLGMLKR
jgi:23S rRNA (adenine2503-C2)-methyltransferase